MESSQFTDSQSSFESLEPLDTQGATCDTYRVKLYGKLHFLKRLKPEFTNDIRYQEAFRKEFETGYRLEHPNLVRYISLTDDGILMEYIDGETLTQYLANHPDYFKDKRNADKFLRQLLDVVGYLHSHQVLHLDLKPDNILLTRINNDVKLVDLGCCYTDTFTDTQGRTNRYAAPEQLSGEEPDTRTDIYAIGRILELLPNHHIYNKVIVRCTAPDPSARYQSVEEIRHDINYQKRYYRYVALFVAIVAVLAVCIALLTHQQDANPVVQELPNDSITAIQKDSISLPAEEREGNHSPAATIPESQAISVSEDVQASEMELTEAQRLEIRHYALRVIRPVYERMIVPVVNRINKGEYDGRIGYVRDSLARVYVTANEEVRAVFRKDAIDKHYPHVSPLEVSNEENNAIGDVMHYYDQLIMHHQYPNMKLPPNPFAE